MAQLLTCPKCRALLDSQAKTCPYCGTDQRPTQARQVDEVAATTRFATWVLGFNFTVYVLMVLLDPGRADARGLGLTPSGDAHVMFGMVHRQLIVECGQYWRLLSAIFLHADLLHLLFNSVALGFIAPLAAHTFGSQRTTVIYLGSGVLASYVSFQFSGYSLGASGAVCGMVAALGVYGWRRGGIAGRMLAKRMGGWALLILAFGFIMAIAASEAKTLPRIDNAAHMAGLVVGAAIGYLAAGVRAIGGRGDRVWGWAARVLVAGAILIAATWTAPSVVRGVQARDARVYRDATGRTLALIADVLDGRRAPRELPARVGDGPWGSRSVRDTLREALTRARKTPESAAARDAFEEARGARARWVAGLKCSHGIGAR